MLFPHCTGCSSPTPNVEEESSETRQKKSTEEVLESNNSQHRKSGGLHLTGHSQVLLTPPCASPCPSGATVPALHLVHLCTPVLPAQTAVLTNVYMWRRVSGVHMCLPRTSQLATFARSAHSLDVPLGQNAPNCLLLYFMGNLQYSFTLPVSVCYCLGVCFIWLIN